MKELLRGLAFVLVLAGALWLADKQYIVEKWEKAEKLWKRA